MTRFVVHEANGPVAVKKDDIQGDTVYICRCGLTQNANGLCDSSHKITKDENNNSYMYRREDGELTRFLLKEECGDCDDGDCSCKGNCGSGDECRGTC